MDDYNSSVSVDAPGLALDSCDLGGSSVVVTYTMRAPATAGGAMTYWSVTGSPDYAGADAPVAVVVAQIVLMGIS